VAIARWTAVGLDQVLARQPPLDRRLRRVQPVQRPIQVFGAALPDAEHAAQRRARGVLVQQPLRGELGGRGDDAGHQ